MTSLIGVQSVLFGIREKPRWGWGSKHPNGSFCEMCCSASGLTAKREMRLQVKENKVEGTSQSLTFNKRKYHNYTF